MDAHRQRGHASTKRPSVTPWWKLGRIAGHLGVLTFVVVCSACASAPFYRPISPPFASTQSAEGGLGAHVAFGRQTMAIGSGGWIHARVTPDIDVVVRGHGTDIFRYDGTTPPFSDVLAGGSLGMRTRFQFRPTMQVGGEVFVDYQSRSGGTGEQLLSGIVGVPVAEEVVPGVSVYTNIALGLSVALHPGARIPMFSFQEIPLGIVWQATPWFLVVAEGGVSLPINGGYAGGALACRW